MVQWSFVRSFPHLTNSESSINIPFLGYHWQIADKFRISIQSTHQSSNWLRNCLSFGAGIWLKGTGEVWKQLGLFSSTSLQWAPLELAKISLCSTKTGGAEIENTNLTFIDITCWTECKEVFHNLILTNKVREWKVIFAQKGTAVLKTLTLKVAAKQQLEWITIIVNNIHYCRKAVSQSIQIPNISMMHELALWLLGHGWNNGLNTSFHHNLSISHSVSKKWKAQLTCTACKYLPELCLYLRFSITKGLLNQLSTSRTAFFMCWTWKKCGNANADYLIW